MRIKFINCTTLEIKKYLDSILDTYDFELSTVNIYVNFYKKSANYDILDANSLNQSFIRPNKNKLYQYDAHNLTCMSDSNIEFSKNLLEYISEWSDDSIRLMQSYLIYKLGRVSDDTRIEAPGIKDIYGKLENILQVIMENTGLILEDCEKTTKLDENDVKED